jgi:tyrosyl-tRNA synthetase
MKNKELEELLEEIKQRGVLSNCANVENFLNLEENERVVYWGIDCTSDSLHIGHLSTLIQLLRFSEKKFTIIFILGGSTSTIGDPSDKIRERPILKKEVIENNYENIKNQLINIVNRNVEKCYDKPLICFYNKTKLDEIYRLLNLDFNNEKEEIWDKFLKTCLPNKSDNLKDFIFLNNKVWLSKLNFLEFMNKIGKNITINYLLNKESIKQRIKSENGISFSEFSYSLLQGYDFLYLYENHYCKGQIGASDQWGNFVTGLKMINNNNHLNKAFAISFNLMLDKNGKKISKSDNNSKIIWISKNKTSADELFDYFNNMEDEETIKFATRFTSIKNETLKKILEINEPKSLRILQRILMELFFFIIHGEKGTKSIREIINLKKIKIY